MEQLLDGLKVEEQPRTKSRALPIAHQLTVCYDLERVTEVSPGQLVLLKEISNVLEKMLTYPCHTYPKRLHSSHYRQLHCTIA